MDEEKIKAKERSMLFFDLLVLMRELVRSQLGLIVNPENGEAVKDLESARKLVDMITVLKEKTEGNLNEQEQRVIDNLISELQMACVKADK